MSDLFAIGYFCLLALLALAQPLPARRRALIVGTAVVMTAAIYGISTTRGPLRDWFPGVTILVAYYVSGMLFIRPSNSIEASLMAWDRRLLGDPAAAFVTWPAWLLTALDVIYLGTFLTVPAGLLALSLAGRMDLADHYWTIVMGSLIVCYTGTAVVHTRPPRILERTRERAERPMQHVALQAVDDFTIGINTIPSGHVAAPLAVGLALMQPLPLIGAAFLLLAIVITVACISGRYHFVVDCALGAVVPLMVWMLQGR
jgi:PAP2 superfamily